MKKECKKLESQEYGLAYIGFECISNPSNLSGIDSFSTNCAVLCMTLKAGRSTARERPMKPQSDWTWHPSDGNWFTFFLFVFWSVQLRRLNKKKSPDQVPWLPSNCIQTQLTFVGLIHLSVYSAVIWGIWRDQKTVTLFVASIDSNPACANKFSVLSIGWPVLTGNWGRIQTCNPDMQSPSVEYLILLVGHQKQYTYNRELI